MDPEIGPRYFTMTFFADGSIGISVHDENTSDRPIFLTRIDSADILNRLGSGNSVAMKALTPEEVDDGSPHNWRMN